jgi:hypothetical protein
MVQVHTTIKMSLSESTGKMSLLRRPSQNKGAAALHIDDSVVVDVPDKFWPELVSELKPSFILDETKRGCYGYRFVNPNGNDQNDEQAKSRTLFAGIYRVRGN